MTIVCFINNVICISLKDETGSIYHFVQSLWITHNATHLGGSAGILYPPRNASLHCTFLFIWPDNPACIIDGRGGGRVDVGS